MIGIVISRIGGIKNRQISGTPLAKLLKTTDFVEMSGNPGNKIKEKNGSNKRPLPLSGSKS